MASLVVVNIGLDLYWSRWMLRDFRAEPSWAGVAADDGIYQRN